MTGANLAEQYLQAIGLDPDCVFVGKHVFYDASLLDGQTKYSKLQKQLNKLIGDGGCINDLLDDTYYCNSETRMLYTTENPLGMEFVYKPSKNVQNAALEKGHWFKLPPGWSLLDVEPVTDETTWGGKRWRDARPYDWGYGGDLANH
ncbi:MAG: hypothetical protein LUC37_02925 [Prevotella sp.]|nr:hypothetical protein [Prevotella sp.]